MSEEFEGFYDASIVLGDEALDDMEGEDAFVAFEGLLYAAVSIGGTCFLTKERARQAILLRVDEVLEAMNPAIIGTSADEEENANVRTN